MLIFNKVNNFHGGSNVDTVRGKKTLIVPEKLKWSKVGGGWGSKCHDRTLWPLDSVLSLSLLKSNKLMFAGKVIFTNRVIENCKGLQIRAGD